MVNMSSMYVGYVLFLIEVSFYFVGHCGSPDYQLFGLLMDIQIRDIGVCSSLYGTAILQSDYRICSHACKHKMLQVGQGVGLKVVGRTQTAVEIFWTYL